MLRHPTNHDAEAIANLGKSVRRGAIKRTGNGASQVNQHIGRGPVPKKSRAEDAISEQTAGASILFR